ncbi:Uncharacterised protein [Mycobacteroides abscessus subsp. abscessus]|nr:Uncharacterised protein [Mycobacteroides abscessus subsp. abscessus]
MSAALNRDAVAISYQGISQIACARRSIRVVTFKTGRYQPRLAVVGQQRVRSACGNRSPPGDLSDVRRFVQRVKHPAPRRQGCGVGGPALGSHGEVDRIAAHSELVLQHLLRPH